jgi:hypothetical protein
MGGDTSKQTTELQNEPLLDEESTPDQAVKKQSKARDFFYDKAYLGNFNLYWAAGSGLSLWFATAKG